MKRCGPLQASGNHFADRARGLKAQRLALILWEAGLRRAGEVRGMSAEQRAMALEILRAGLGSRRPVTASEQTWAGVASLVGWLGGGSGGRRQVPSLPQSLAGLGARDVTRPAETACLGEARYVSGLPQSRAGLGSTK